MTRSLASPLQARLFQDQRRIAPLHTRPNEPQSHECDCEATHESRDGQARPGQVRDRDRDRQEDQRERRHHEQVLHIKNGRHGVPREIVGLYAHRMRPRWLRMESKAARRTG